MKIYRATIQLKGDIEMVYVATHPPEHIVDQFALDFLYNEKKIFFYFLDEEEMKDYIDGGSEQEWDLIDFKYLTEKLSIHFELFSKNWMSLCRI